MDKYGVVQVRANKTLIIITNIATLGVSYICLDS